MILFIHYEATAGPEPYLLSIEAEAGPNAFKGLVRPPVTVQPPKGITEQQLSRSGLEARMVVPWMSQMAKTCRTVVVYDRGQFLRMMDCELSRLGKSEWVRPSIEIIDLADKATPLAKIKKGDGFKKPTLEEAAQIVLAQNPDGLSTIKALHAHKEIQTMLEVA